jgi:hypothetical protein
MKMKNKIVLSACITGLFFLLSPFLCKAQTVYTVTDSTDGTTAGKLRYAITQANLNSGPSIIKFNVPLPGTVPINFVINTSLGALPTITKTVTIDGTTQPGYSIGNSRIRLVGVTPPATTFATGFLFSNAPGCKLLAIRLWGFVTGVSIQFSNNCEIRGCSINRCITTTVELLASSYCIIKGSTINTDKSGVNLYATGTNYNALTGISIKNSGTTGSSYNIIGGQACDEGNTIAYTQNIGIDNAAGTPSLNVSNRFSGNKIYGTGGVAIYLRAAANANIQPPVIPLPASCFLTGTSTTPFGIVEVFSATSGTADQKSALQFLATTTANASGAWSVAIGVSPTDRVTATITDPVTSNTSELVAGVQITPSSMAVISPVPGGVDGYSCLGKELTFTVSATNVCTPSYLWNFGDGSPVTETATHLFPHTGSYVTGATAYSASGCSYISSAVQVNISLPCPPLCTDCIGSFAPEGGKYIITGWAKKETAPATDTTYSTPRLQITFPTSSTGSFYSFAPSGRIIDGWQRIEGEFTVPSSGVTDIKINLKCLGGSGNCLFDDIRVFPTDGSMKSYVYDPISMKLVAELDERNYSTFYEYDEEGKLVRVKKETEKGIMTIKENRDNTNKR